MNLLTSVRSPVAAPAVSLLLVLALAGFAGPLPAQDTAAPAEDETAASSCVACHGNPDWFEGEQLAIGRSLEEDAHHAAGLGCADCHGGNPDPALAEDMVAAMDPEYEPNPYLGVPERTAVPDFCGRCHSDPTYMRRFQPDARVDQQQEYLTSQHGILLTRGDERVATCVDCHGVHPTRPPGDSESPVYPRNVAETCRACHADPELMAGATLPDGSPLPVDQYARWRRSVHAAAMFDKEDLSAPTCNDCHGNHGALPPGLESIAFVCGQCHGREAELFRASSKRQGYRDHNDFLASVGDLGCSGCHTEPLWPEEARPLRELSECATCHGNHGVVRPTVAMLSPLPEIPCTLCHGTGVVEGADLAELTTVREPEEIRRHYEEERDRLLALAAEEGLEGEDRFNWMVDRARDLPAHTAAGGDGSEGSEGDGPRLRPEFQRLFDKFRIGKTYYTYPDPVSGETVQAPVVRCTDCHQAEPDLAPEAAGLDTSRAFLEQMTEVTALTARAERMLLAARRGGVEVREPAASINQAVDAQIELEVLVHTFDSGEEGAFHEKYEAGLEHAQTALTGAREALEELAFRHRGLLVSLALIALVLVGLALKIRQLPER